jgi:hypothetical protein
MEKEYNNKDGKLFGKLKKSAMNQKVSPWWYGGWGGEQDVSDTPFSLFLAL